MTMVLDDQTTFCNDTEWQDRVRQSSIAYARVVRVEDSSVDGHDLRVDLATKVLSEPDLWKLAITYAVATDAAMTLTPSDSDIATAVENAWDDVALLPGPV